MDLPTVAYALIAAVVYAASFYLKNHVATSETFDLEKFAATLLVALIIGTVSALTGSPLTEEDVIMQLISYAGLVALIESWIKTLVRGIQGEH